MTNSMKNILIAITFLAVSIFLINISASHNPAWAEERVHSKAESHNDHEQHKGEQHHESHGGNGHEEPPEASEVKLKSNQVKLAGIKTAPAISGEINIELQLTGEVSFNENRLAHIVPRVPGVVHEVLKTMGDSVKKNEIMAILESSELGEAKTAYIEKKQQMDLAGTDLKRTRSVHDNTIKMLDFLKTSPSLGNLKKMSGVDLGTNRTALVSSYSELVFSRTKYVREKELYEKKISSADDYLEAENEYKKAEAEYAATRDDIAFSIKRSLLEMTRAQRVARLSLYTAQDRLYILGLAQQEIKNLSSSKEKHENLTRYAVQAPFDGTIIERHITQGEQVDDESELYMLCNMDIVWVIASVNEKDIARVKKGQSSVIMVKAYEGHEFTGKVTWVSDTLDEDTRTLKVRVAVDNKERLLKPGMFAQITLEVGSGQNVLTIHPSAIQRQKGESIVFVSKGDGRFERREVRPGAITGTKAEIIEGVTEGEEIVTSGSFILKSELEKEGFEAGHAH